MKILVAEDDRRTAEYLRDGLSESGFVVDLAENGKDALLLALTRTYDLIVLDVRLPQRNGWDVIAALREAGKKTPTLFLTACDAVTDRVKGLELGADDYLVKPFAFSELRARIHSILRRGPERRAETIEIADLSIDLVHGKVARGGRRIHLTAKEFGLLSLFARHRGEILPRTMIAEQVWDMNFDCDTNVVDVAVRRLRGKIDDAFEKKLIYSVRGMGYVLEER